MNGPTNKGEWVTNFPRSIKGVRKRNVKIIEGDPKPTKQYSTKQLKRMKIVGIYLDEDCPDGYYSRDFV